MIVILDLDKQTLAYKNNEPFIQGEDSRNVLQVAVPYSEVTSSFDIQIAYQLQNGRSTIKMANSGVDEETLTIDGVVYALINFNIPRIATSLSGNLLMTLIVNTSDNKLYKFNALNVVLSRVEFEEWEEAFADSALLEEVQAMESSISSLQSAVANRVINGVNPQPLDVSFAGMRFKITNAASPSPYNYSNTIGLYNDASYLVLEKTAVDNNVVLSAYNRLQLNGADRILLLGDDYSISVKSSDADKGIEFYNEQGTAALLVKIDESGVKSNVPYYYNNDLVATQSYVNSKVYGNSISLSGANGTLTDEQLAVITSYKDPIIYYTDSLGVVFTLQLKQKYQNRYDFTLDVSTIVPNYVSVIKYDIKVFTNTKFWVFESANKNVASKTYVDDADNNLQSQIDGLNAGQNLADIVADLTALGNLDTSKLQANDKVQVLVDSNHDNASTVYNWSGSAWVYIGKYGQDGYTKSEADTLLATKQNVIDNNNKLSSDLVDDTNDVHKFVTQAEKQYWNSKFDGDLLADTDSTEIISWGTEDPAFIEPHVGIQVKDSYIESFFATDSEVQNMLEEVFA